MIILGKNPRFEIMRVFFFDDRHSIRIEEISGKTFEEAFTIYRSRLQDMLEAALNFDERSCLVESEMEIIKDDNKWIAGDGECIAEGEISTPHGVRWWVTLHVFPDNESSYKRHKRFTKLNKSQKRRYIHV